MSKDLYSILGVSKTASKDDIKKAYRKLSKELHPDKHKGDKTKEQQFKEVNEAYEVLSDDTKRQRYDQFGNADGPQFSGQGFGGFDFSNMQDNMGGFGDIFESFFGSNTGSKREREQGRDIEVQLRISFMEAVSGVKKTIRLQRLRTCTECSGSGAAKGAKVVQCSQCHGSGQVVRTMQSFLGTVQQSSICNQCRGAGTIPEKACTQCQGEGRTKLTEEIEVNVPAGIADGQALRIQQGGESGKNGKPAGDLYVHIIVDTNSQFEREGDDIHSKITVHVLDAILGTTLPVTTVHGPVELKIPEGTQSNQVLRIKSKGMPVLNTNRFGDHYVTVQIEIPTSLSRAERKILEQWQEMR